MRHAGVLQLRQQIHGRATGLIAVLQYFLQFKNQAFDLRAVID